MSYTLPRGTRDLLSPQVNDFRHIETTAAKLFALYGYQEIRTPIFERLELFERGIGDTTDIVEKEMYCFADRKGRNFALRPEGTAGTIRAYVENKLYTSQQTCKLYYQGPMFRYERPQAGRYRQFLQLGAEVLGDSSPYIDAEVISMLDQLFGNLGFSGYQTQINSVGCPQCRPTFRSQLISYYQDKLETLCGDCQNRLERNPLRLLDCKNSNCRKHLAQAPKITDHLCPGCQEHYSAVKVELANLGVNYVENHLQVRGLDYYTKTTFEVIYSQLGAQNTIAAGGRYDNLVADIGGPQTPGIGFAIGLDRLVLCLQDAGLQQGTAQPQICMITLGANAFRYCTQLTHKLRTKGVFVLLPADPGKSLKAQMRAANRHHPHLAVIVGDNELKRGAIIVKDMLQSTQVEVSADTAFEQIMTQLRP